MRNYYFYGVAYQKIMIDGVEEEYEETFEKIIESRNKEDAKKILEKELSDFDRIEIQTSYLTDGLATI